MTVNRYTHTRAIQEFEDIVVARGETIDSLEKKFGLIPQKDGVLIRLEYQRAYYNKKDIIDILSEFKKASEPSGMKGVTHTYSVIARSKSK